MQSVTYPPELLPSPDEDDEAEVIVVDPESGNQTTIEIVPNDAGCVKGIIAARAPA